MPDNHQKQCASPGCPNPPEFVLTGMNNHEHAHVCATSVVPIIQDLLYANESVLVQRHVSTDREN